MCSGCPAESVPGGVRTGLPGEEEKMKKSRFMRAAAAMLAIAVCMAALMSAAGARTVTTRERNEYGNPLYSPIGTYQDGEVEVLFGTNGSRKQIRDKPDPNSNMVCALDPGSRYPCYGEQTGSNRKPWYYIYVPEKDYWGWISSAVGQHRSYGSAYNDDGYDSGSYDDYSSGGYPSVSRRGTSLIGEVEILFGTNGSRKNVRDQADPYSNRVCSLDPGKFYPCYEQITGTDRKTWYFIYIPEKDYWGWISSVVAELHRDGTDRKDTRLTGKGGYPASSPLNTERYGSVEIVIGERKTVRERPDPDSGRVAMVEPGMRYPCYGTKRGTTGKYWYYIYIPEMNAWGWISSILATWYP